MKELALFLLLAFNPKMTQTGFKLEDKKEYKNQVWISDKNGVINPNLILKLEVGQVFRFYATDGTQFDAVLKQQAVENNSVYKVFGDILNYENAAFGFALTNSGTIAGAIVLKETDTVYTVEESAEHNGLVVKKTKSGKVESRNQVKN